MKEVCILEVYRFLKKRMKEDEEDGEMAEEEEDGGM